MKTCTQTRPLFGQAAHVANLSLLFKSTKYGWEGQIAGSYTGKRLSDISNWYDDDIWKDGYMQLDASVEKSFKNGISLLLRHLTCWILLCFALFRMALVRRMSTLNVTMAM